MVLKTFADGMIKFTIHNWHFKQTKNKQFIWQHPGDTEGAIPLNQTNVHMFYIKIRFTCKNKKQKAVPMLTLVMAAAFTLPV